MSPLCRMCVMLVGLLIGVTLATALVCAPASLLWVAVGMIVGGGILWGETHHRGH